MRFNTLKATMKTAIFAISVLLLAAGQSFGQAQQVSLTAGPATTTLPDGNRVPMWGYSCQALPSGVTSTATCGALNPNAGGNWSPVVITLPAGSDLQINLTNNLSFTPQGSTTANGIPTSITIVGQVGGGLGAASQRTTNPSPLHDNQPVTWATTDAPGAVFSPPTQLPRVQSFATEVAAGATTSLTWTAPAPGTYLIESGTHPSIQGPMGLYGILVVTTLPSSTVAGVAYPAAGTKAAVQYNAEVPLIFSEIDPVFNNAVTTAVNTTGFAESATYGPYLSGPVVTIKLTNGGTGYTSVPAVNFIGTNTSGTSAPSAVAVIDTDPTSSTYQQVIALTLSQGGNYAQSPMISITGGGGSGATAVAALELNPGELNHCQGGAACYPPAVNYTPLYYTINGASFNKTMPSSSLFSAIPSSAVSGNVLVRLVNAGLKMHVPSIVGSTTGAGSVPGFSLIAEDGNVLPGIPRVQNEVFMPAGKTYDVMVNVPASTASALPIYDRELSLSGNATARDTGMLAYIQVNGSSLPTSGVFSAAAITATAANDEYDAIVAGQTLTVSDPGKGVIANDTNVFGVALLTGPTQGTLTLNKNGTFTYVANGTWASPDTFTYCANGTVSGSTCSSGLVATVTLKSSSIVDSGITIVSQMYTANTAQYLAIKTPGLLAAVKDGANLPVSIIPGSIVASSGLTVYADKNGGFTATVASANTYTFAFQAQNSLGVTSAGPGTTCVASPTTSNPEPAGCGLVTILFPPGSGLTVNVVDGYTKTPITDYRWVIEEDKTFYVNPLCTTNGTVPGVTPPATCPAQINGSTPTYGVNFHTSHMPFVAQGCTGPLSCEAGQTQFDNGTPCTSPGVPAGCSQTAGTHVAVVCDVSNGVCRPGSQQTQLDPSLVALDPTKRYYISVLPGDAANAFIAGNTSACLPTTDPNYDPSSCGHGMGGAPIGLDPATGVQQSSVTVLSEPNPYPPGKLSVFVFEDDYPLNGEHDGGGGVDVLAPNEPGLGGFQIHLWDAMGGNGDFTGQMTYDMFNQPLSNSLAGTIDPATGNDACPVVATPRDPSDPTSTGITGMIVTCPKYESDGLTLSPLAGQAVVANLMPGRWGVVATPGADRIARGEEWLQTNTLDGQKAHDVFTRIGEPIYFQEYGPASYHVTIGFANPAIINARLAGVCNGTDPNAPNPGQTYTCNNSIIGKVTGERLSRTPDERLYSSGSRDTYGWTQCYVSVGDPDGEDFAFTKCAADGTFTLNGLPPGQWRLTTFDQWNDQLVDGLSTPVGIGGGTTTNIGDVAATQWQTNLYTKTFIDDDKTGVATAASTGIPFANVAVRLRDGSLENLLLADFTGTANFNETFPLFSWYVVETDVTRYKNTGTHVVYDAGGPADGSPSCGQSGYPPCGSSTIGNFLANTAETVSLPTSPINLRVPGAVYCKDADCSTHLDSAVNGIQKGSAASDPPSVCTTTNGNTSCSTVLSTGRIDPPWSGGVEGWQGFPGQNNFIEFGKEPYAEGENGGIIGHVIYASTRPFDDPQMLVQTQWEPLVPNVTINLYQEGFASDNVTPTLKLVDTTVTSSWDDFAQGFHVGPDGHTLVPNMNCPGQTTSDLFFFTLYNQPDYLSVYNQQHGGPAVTPIPYNSQFKCYDGMHNWNQIQPAPYDGMYSFPSVTSVDPVSGKPTGTNCTICKANTAADSNDLYYGTPMLPAGKYVVEVVVPQGFELVKEEDKNILIGDNFIAPVTQQFGGLGNIFIMPDQASVASSQQYPGPGYNANNAQNATQSLGASPQNGIVPGFVPEPVWPCVGEARIVPDYISLYPGSQQVSPFAGALRNLCDRKEVTLADKMHAIAKFYVYTSTHIASKFTGGITDDFTSEFDPFSPQFGEKFAPPDLPIGLRDWTGQEIGRVYADHWGAYNGMVYSTWEVNPPNPTGYSPNMMIYCMNDPGPTPDPTPGATHGQMVTDPLFQPGYSQFCYELPFMPGTTQYLDTPVVPTAAFSEGYNHPDCSYPDATPAVSEVDGDLGVGPWISAFGHALKIHALGNQTVINNGYSGPSATTAPFNEKTITRHYGFGGTQGTGSVVIGGVTAAVTSWSDTEIDVTVPKTDGKHTMAQCAVQQQAQFASAGTGTNYGTSFCGELVITTGAGKQSIDTVTVTIAGKTPTVVSGTTPMTNTSVGSLQTAIDNAYPGDMLIVPAGTYNEMVILWKPVRLQGVGAASSIINANTHPAGKLDQWRARVSCLFGLATNGQPYTDAGAGTPGVGNAFDPTGTFTCGGWNGFTAKPAVGNVLAGAEVANPQVDRLPLEGILGWDTTVNGNLAQLLQEPTLMGAYEGSGILVLSKGVKIPAGATGYYGSGGEAAFPTGTLNLTGSTADCGTGTPGHAGYVKNPYPSNFQCNPSAIDALSVTDSSQGGGGIFVHAWGHNLQVANNRVYNNIGTLSGGINIGQGESPDIYSAGTVNDTDPGSCNLGPNGTSLANAATGTELPYCFDLNVNVHNNYVAQNTSIGDELFSGTPAGAGGASICTGADYYKFNYNWVCGNMSTGDGGGFSHVGFIYYGDIEHNTIIFNQSLNPTISTNGGGILVMGAAPDGFNAAGLECGGTVADADCAPGLPDGTGPGLVINANLIQGNAAEAGSGGGLRLQSVNGTEISAFPNGNPTRTTTPLTLQSQTPWNLVTVTNNIIVNNVAGWDGGGVSLQDALAVNLVNNTIASNDSTATAGVLFNTLGAPNASAPGVGLPGQTSNGTSSLPQPAGLVTTLVSPNLLTEFGTIGTSAITCPAGYAGCTKFSNPRLASDVFWQNRSFYIGVGSLSSAYQQNVVTLYNLSGTPASGTGAQSQATTGQCLSNSGYWDLGVRGDTAPGNHGSGSTLAPTYSVLTNASENGTGTNNLLATNPQIVGQYCNGSRIPPEFGGSGWQVPPGISDATVPNPIFNLTPAATVDEGNNWVNLQWGPLSMVNPVTNATLGNYILTGGSPAIDYVPTSVSHPTTDFFGNPRPDPATPTLFDVGAVEFQAPANTAILSVRPTSLTFAGQIVGSTSANQTLTLTNEGGAQATGITVTVTAPFARNGGTCGATLNGGATCTILVDFHPTAAGPASGTVTIGSTNPGTVDGSPVQLTGTGIAQVVSATVTPASLAFGNWANGTTSSVQTLTVTNTGNVALTGGAFTFGGGAPQPFARSGGTCAGTLAVGASCTVGVRFAPPGGTGTVSYSRTLTVAYTGATVTGSPVTLTGTGVPARAPLAVTPNPQTINVAAGFLAVGTSTVTLTNNAPAGGAQVLVTSVTESGGTILTYLFTDAGLTDGCTGTTLAPGASCTVQVGLIDISVPSGSTRTGSVSFADNGSTATQTGTLNGVFH